MPNTTIQQQIDALAQATRDALANQISRINQLTAIKVDKADADDAEVTATGSTTARTLANRFSDVINVKDFGAKGDGVTDDTTAIKSAIEAGAEAGKSLWFEEGKTYKLTGWDIIEFKSGAEFNGCTIDIEDLKQDIFLDSPGEGWTEQERWASDSSALSLLQDSSIDAQSVKVSAWADYADISGCCVRIKTNQYYYTYRGEDVLRKELNVVTDKGSLLSPVKYQLDGSYVTSVEKMPFNKKATLYSDVTFKLGSRHPAYWGVVRVMRSSNVKLSNISFDVPAGEVYPSSSMFALFTIQESFHVEVDGLYFTAPIHKEDNSASYCISLGDSYDVKIKNAIGQGAGWGVTGSNYCWRVEYENCDLSRIDFHQPFFEYLKVKDCTIGVRGIGVTAVGDLYVDRTTFVLEETTLNQNGVCVVGAREELGGLCDGNVFMNDCKVINKYSGFHRSLFYCNGDNGDALKSGSPLCSVFWHNITVKNLTCFGGDVNLLPIIVGPTSAPKNIHFENVYGNVKAECSFDEGTNYYGADSSLHIDRIYTYRNIPELKSVRFLMNYGSDFLSYKKILFDNVGRLNEQGTEFSFCGNYDVIIRDSEVKKICEFGSGKNSVRVISCRIDTTNVDKPLSFKDKNNYISFENCLFVNQPTKEMFTGTDVVGIDDSDKFNAVLGHIVFTNNRVLNRTTGRPRDEIILESLSTPALSISYVLTGLDMQTKNSYYATFGNGSSEWHSMRVSKDGLHATKNIYINNEKMTVNLGFPTNDTISVESPSSGTPVRTLSIAI